MDMHDPATADRSENERASIGGNNPPDPIDLIDPENLVDLDLLPAALRRYYPLLTERRDELTAAIERWMAQHTQPPAPGARPAPPVIADEIDAGATADFLKQLATFAGQQGEAEQARQRVKRKPFDACKLIDSYFNEGLKGPVEAGRAAIQQAATAYVLRKEAEERERRRLAAEAAKAEADRLSKLAEEATAPPGIADRAVEAEERAYGALAEIDAPVTDAGRVRGDHGAVLSGRSTWKVHVTDMKKVAAAVARGDLAADWITLNETVANAMVRGKNGKRNKDLPRDCGISIEEVRTAR